MPALGYKVIRIVAGKRGAAVSSTASDVGDTIQLSENGLHVIVDKKSGCITSLKQGDSEALAPGACGNELQFFKDTPKQYDAWNVDPGTLDSRLRRSARPIRLN